MRARGYKVTIYIVQTLWGYNISCSSTVSWFWIYIATTTEHDFAATTIKHNFKQNKHGLKLVEEEFEFGVTFLRKRDGDGVARWSQNRWLEFEFHGGFMEDLGFAVGLGFTMSGVWVSRWFDREMEDGKGKRVSR